MKALITAAQANSYKGKDGETRRFGTLHFVAGRASSDQNTVGLPTAALACDYELAQEVGKQVPGIFDIDIMSEKRFGEERPTIVSAEYAGPLGAFNVSERGIERAAAPARPGVAGNGPAAAPAAARA